MCKKYSLFGPGSPVVIFSEIHASLLYHTFLLYSNLLYHTFLLYSNYDILFGYFPFYLQSKIHCNLTNGFFK